MMVDSTKQVDEILTPITQADEILTPLEGFAFHARPEPKPGFLKKAFGFDYPAKPPGWEHASLIEKFAFATIPISDFMGRIGAKITEELGITEPEQKEQVLSGLYLDELEWSQKTPEAIGWTMEKVAEYKVLSSTFALTGLSSVLTRGGEKLAMPFMAKELASRGGPETLRTLSKVGLKNLVRRGLNSFLRSAPENTAFISSWSALDALKKGKSLKEIEQAAVEGAGWGLALSAGMAVIGNIATTPEVKTAAHKAFVALAKKYPRAVDAVSQPIGDEFLNELAREMTGQRGADVRLLGLTKRQLAQFRNAARSVKSELQVAAGKEAAIAEYWRAGTAKRKWTRATPTEEAALYVKEHPAREILQKEIDLTLEAKAGGIKPTVAPKIESQIAKRNPEVVMIPPEELPEESVDFEDPSSDVILMKTVDVFSKLGERYTPKEMEDGYREWIKTPEGGAEASLGKEGTIREGIRMEIFARLVLSNKPKALAAMKKATEAAEEFLVEENPYLSMPLDVVESHADYGVKAAKDALIDLGEIGIEPATEEQKTQIANLMNRYGFDSEASKALNKYTTGMEDVEQFTSEDADNVLEALDNYERLSPGGIEAITKEENLLIDPSLDEGAMKMLRRKTQSTEAYNRVIHYSNALGGAPSNPDVPDVDGRRGLWNINLGRIARKTRRHVKREVAAERPGKREVAAERPGKVDLMNPSGKVDLMNPYQSISYSLDKAEARSGYPLRRTWSDIVAEAMKYSHDNERVMWAAIKKAGVHRLGKVMDYESNVKIGAWLDEMDGLKRGEIWSSMDSKTQSLAEELEHVLQNEGGRALRWAQFVKWDFHAKKAEEMINKITSKGKKPSSKQIKAADAMIEGARPYNAPRSALTEGRIAKEMGQFDDWLDTQEWGSRKRYFMHEAEMIELTDGFYEGSIPQEILEAEIKAGTLPLKAPSETEARKGPSKVIKTGNAALAVLRHLDRLTSFASTYDHRVRFWDAFSASNPSKQDLSLMRKADATVRGIFEPSLPVIKKFRSFDRYFWRNYLVFNPSGSLWFAWRQTLQNLALAPSQFNMKEVGKSMVRLPWITSIEHWMKNNPDATESFKEFYGKHVSESRSVYRHFIMKSQELSGLEMTSKAGTLADMLGFMPALTDRGNRFALWPVAYNIAERNVNLFKEGKIGAKKLWNRLSLNTITPGQSLEFLNLLDDENYSEFMSRYAEYKVENVHFRYNPLLRSTQEMSITGRTLMGLTTFPRGVINIVWKNGIEPMASGNPRQTYDGFKTLLKLVIGTTVMNELSKRIAGYSAYDLIQLLFGYSLLSPGMSSAIEMFKDTSSIAGRHAREGRSKGETAIAMAKTAVGNLETFIPLCDTACDIYEAQGDVEQVHLWTLAKAQGMSDWEGVYHKPFKKRDRTFIEKIRLVVFGREMKKAVDEWKKLSESL